MIRIILKQGFISPCASDYFDINSELEALAINPSAEVNCLVQKIMYLKTSVLTISDVIRSKILKDHDQIRNLFKLCEILEFGTVETTVSSSNRNLGQEVFTLKKNSKISITSTAKGRARFNLFRINKDLIYF